MTYRRLVLKGGRRPPNPPPVASVISTPPNCPGPEFDHSRFQSHEEQKAWFAILARTISVDFDGVLHPYTAGWVGATPADEPPVSGAPEFLGRLRAAGYRIVISSARCDTQEGIQGITDWLVKWGLVVDEITCLKPPAFAYVDDRAVPFQGNWEDVDAGVARLAAGRAHGAAPAADTP